MTRREHSCSLNVLTPFFIGNNSIKQEPRSEDCDAKEVHGMPFNHPKVDTNQQRCISWWRFRRRRSNEQRSVGRWVHRVRREAKVKEKRYKIINCTLFSSFLPKRSLFIEIDKWKLIQLKLEDCNSWKQWLYRAAVYICFISSRN